MFKRHKPPKQGLRCENREVNKKMADLLVVKAKIKDYVGDMNVAGDFADELSKKVEMLVKEAAKRADANGRKTVQAKDL